MQRNSHHLSQMNQNREGNLASVLPHHRRSRLCFCHHKITIQSTMRDVDFANYVKSVYQRCYKIILLKKKAKKKNRLADWPLGKKTRRMSQDPLLNHAFRNKQNSASSITQHNHTSYNCSNLHAASYSVDPLSLTHTDTLIINRHHRQQEQKQHPKENKRIQENCPDKIRWPRRHQQIAESWRKSSSPKDSPASRPLIGAPSRASG
jgi:hypothetical protein